MSRRSFLEDSARKLKIGWGYQIGWGYDWTRDERVLYRTDKRRKNPVPDRQRRSLYVEVLLLVVLRSTDCSARAITLRTEGWSRNRKCSFNTGDLLSFVPVSLQSQPVDNDIISLGDIIGLHVLRCGHISIFGILDLLRRMAILSSAQARVTQKVIARPAWCLKLCGLTQTRGLAHRQYMQTASFLVASA